ncbi:3-oxoacyl-[acyl-carrier-protein] reductase FabG [Shewanella sp. P1-14-1]|uniref:SDR family oxidoreductase n=1 Tax=Shewanella sp. P1-14-1 TaxID=1723761 RepID=UPI0006D66496|nr:SDR family oxidoreductase [Shewanella sp. P1-14-1]KPZ71271.1 3-oxoacyl-[acyl-carrier-protein] reductase FabG [Shewanella sp. P1-14-1]
MSFSISNKVVFITGANRGIGKSITEHFIDQGAKKVYLAVRNPNSTKSLEEQYGDKVETIQVDITDEVSILAAAKTATDVDVVINNAGIISTVPPLADNALDTLKVEMDVNVYGLMRVAKAFEATLIANQGALVQLNSVASLKNYVDMTTYCTSKAASYSVTQGLRDHFKPHNVSVLSVHPGVVATDMADITGFTDIASSPQVVPVSILSALDEGQFHVFPDAVAKQIEVGFQSYADNVIMQDFAV